MKAMPVHVPKENNTATYLYIFSTVHKYDSCSSYHITTKFSNPSKRMQGRSNHHNHRTKNTRWFKIKSISFFTLICDRNEMDENYQWTERNGVTSGNQCDVLYTHFRYMINTVLMNEWISQTEFKIKMHVKCTLLTLLYSASILLHVTVLLCSAMHIL